MSKKLPLEVQWTIDYLNKYELSDSIITFHILHLYPSEIVYPNGYVDAKLFTCMAFNTSEMKGRVFESHNEVKFDEGCEVDTLRVLMDGSYLIRFKHPVSLIGAGYAIHFQKE